MTYIFVKYTFVFIDVTFIEKRQVQV